MGTRRARKTHLAQPSGGAVSFDLADYVDVKTRLRLAMAKYPDLTITELPPRVIELPDGKTFIEAAVVVGRAPDDTNPVQAYCWEPYPGKTGYTRDSEQPNAATSALGRALGYMGFGIDKSLASANEVRNRQADTHPSADYDEPAPVVQMRPRQSSSNAGQATDGQKRLIREMSNERAQPVPDLDAMTFDDAKAEINRLKTVPKVK